MISTAHAVTVTEVLLDAGQGTKRKYIEIQNLDASNAVHITFGGAAATALNGIRIAAGATWKLEDQDGNLSIKGELRAIAITGTVNVVVLEINAVN